MSSIQGDGEANPPNANRLELATVNDLPLMPTMKLTDFDTAAQTRAHGRGIGAGPCLSDVCANLLEARRRLIVSLLRGPFLSVSTPLNQTADGVVCAQSALAVMICASFDAAGLCVAVNPPTRTSLSSQLIPRPPFAALTERRCAMSRRIPQANATCAQPALHNPCFI